LFGLGLPGKSYLAVGFEERDVSGAVTDSAKMELWRVTLPETNRSHLTN